ncbi:hypothetical protein [Thioalkalivibrio sp. ALE19]|uniref:hypothetical protein n=1 Tax=Thioalkalivibrio sp. ALE19 TaxID=1266909 RepID=UPI00040346C5|nr:hypothetical protein [Thioalkalivibrio sp. ALE19]
MTNDNDKKRDVHKLGHHLKQADKALEKMSSALLSVAPEVEENTKEPKYRTFGGLDNSWLFTFALFWAPHEENEHSPPSSGGDD